MEIQFRGTAYSFILLFVSDFRRNEAEMRAKKWENMTEFERKQEVGWAGHSSLFICICSHWAGVIFLGDSNWGTQETSSGRKKGQDEVHAEVLPQGWDLHFSLAFHHIWQPFVTSDATRCLLQWRTWGCAQEVRMDGQYRKRRVRQGKYARWWGMVKVSEL